MSCLNISHPQYINLLKSTGLDNSVLYAKIKIWQEENNTTLFPTREDILKESDFNSNFSEEDLFADNITQPTLEEKYGVNSLNELKKEIEDVKKELPQLSIEVQKGLLNGIGGIKAEGKFYNGIITLSDIASVGTMYHEAFHAVSNSILSKEQQDKLYKQVLDKTGIADKNLAEEYLAEEYRNYRKSKFDSPFQWFFDLLEQLINFVTRDEVGKVFLNTRLGRYKNKTLVNRSRKPLYSEVNQFTYLDKSILTDFPLTTGQETALKRLIDFHYSDQQFITLQGYAGTGKTTTIKYLENYLKGQGVSFNYFAPTHAATIELAMANLALNKKTLPSTIASSFKTNSETGKKEFSEKFLRSLGYGENILVIDEISLLSSSDLNTLIELLKNNKSIKVIFMGDPLQLPEVTVTEVASKPVSEAFTKFEQIQLTEIKRTSENSILTVLNNLRKNKNGKIPYLKTSSGIYYFEKGNFDKSIIKAFKESPLETTYLGYTNKSVTEANLKIREALGFSDDLKPGEIILGYGGYNNKTVIDGDIGNSVPYKVTSVEKDGSRIIIKAESDKLNLLRQNGVRVEKNATTTYMQLNDSDSFTFSGMTREEMQENNTVISEKFKQVYEILLQAKKNKKLFPLYFYELDRLSAFLKKHSLGDNYVYNPSTNRLEIFNKENHKTIIKNFPFLKVEKGVDFGYAKTIHKSQGSTVKNVFFDTSTLPKSSTTLTLDGKEFSTEKHSMLYVALSRASKNLVVLNAGDNFYKVEPEERTIQQPEANQEKDISTFTNYSGEASGADTLWENVGKEFGLGKQVNYKPEDLKKLTKEQLQEVENAYQQAVKELGRKPLDANTFAGGLVRRDYLQAKSADSIFAISDIILPGEKGKSVKGIRYSNKLNKPIVDGGTGYAVQMGINLGKPVYVFHQGTNSDNKVEIGWYIWNSNNNSFERVNTPSLTRKFAGIGTREINENGKQAIRNVYEKTLKEFKNISQQPIEIKEGVSELFESNSELANIGTQEQYSQYLDTIFPDSKVKDIIYRRSPRSNVEKFHKREKRDGYNQPGISSITKEYIDRIKNFGENLYTILVDIKNPFITNKDYDLLTKDEGSQENGYDGIISKDGEINVFEPEQIHILGSKQDIDGFKEFINKETQENITLTQNISQEKLNSVTEEVDEEDLRHQAIYNKYSKINLPADMIDEAIQMIAYFNFHNGVDLEGNDLDSKSSDDEYRTKKATGIHLNKTKAKLKYTLVKKMEEALDRDELEIAESLDLLLDNFDSLFDIALDNLKSIGYTVKTKDDGLVQETQTMEVSYSDSALNLNPKDNIAGKIKKFLTFIPSTEKGKYFGLRKSVDFDRIYSDLMRVLSNTSTLKGDLENLVRTKIKNNAHLYKDFEAVLTYLDKQTPQIKRGFFTSLTKLNVDYNVSLINTGKETSFKLINADTNNHSKNVLDSWSLNISNTAFDSDGKLKEAYKVAILNYREKFLAIRNDETHPLNSIKNSRIKYELDTKNQIDETLKLAHKLLNGVGLNISLESVERAFYSIDEKDRITWLSPDNFKGAIGWITKLNTATSGVGYQDSLLSIEKFDKEGKNPVNNNQGVKLLAKTEASKEVGSEGTMVVGPDGKQYYTFSNNNTAFILMNNYKTSDDLLTQRLESVYHKHSLFLNEMNEDSIEQRKNYSISVVLSNRFENIEEDKGQGMEMKKDDIYIDRINKVLQGSLNPGNKGSIFPVLTPADKKIFIELKGFSMNRIFSYEKAVEDIYFKYFFAEYERILLDKESPVKVYSEKRKMFYQFPSFNRGTELSKKLELYNSDGSIITLDNDKIKEIKKELTEFFKERVQSAYNEFLSLGLIDKSAQKINGLDTRINNSFNGEGFESKVHEILANFVANSYKGNTEFTMMFSGDPAFYKDLAKRAFASGASGLDLFIDDNDPNTKQNFNVAVLKDENNSVDQIILDSYAKAYKERYSLTDEEAREMANSYNDGDRTDASGLCTIEEYKSKMIALSKWDDEMDAALDKLLNNVYVTPAELGRFQPLKGVHFELVQEGDLVVPVYLKYSLFPLIPSVIKNTGLEHLSNEMKRNKTDQLIYASGIKVGGRNPELSSKMLTGEPMNFSNIKLDNNFWKLQQDLEPKYFKNESAKDASQYRKNILANLDTEGEYNLNGKKILGKDLVVRMNAIESLLSENSTEEFKKQFGINGETLSPEGIDKVYNLLIEKYQGKFPINVIEGLESRLPFSAILGMTDKIEQELLAYFNTASIHLDVPGGAFIQIPDYGFQNVTKRSLDELNEIQGIKWFINNDGLKPPRIENGEFKGGQVLLPFHVVKHIKNYDELTGKELKELLGDSLKDLIGYRIPNQNMSSIDLLEVVGVLPEIMGDSIVVYNGLTVKTGSDFDIDKMYVMMKNVAYNKQTKKYEPIKFLDESVSIKERYKAYYKKFIEVNFSEEILNNKKFNKEIEVVNKRVAEQRDNIHKEINDNLAKYGEDFKKTKKFKELVSNKRELYNEFLPFNTYEEIIDELIKEAQSSGLIETLESFSKKSIFQQNTKEALQNEKLANYKAILTSKKGFAEMVTPLDSSELKYDAYYINILEKKGLTEANKFAELSEKEKKKYLEKFLAYKDLEEFDVITQIDIKERNDAGKAGIGQTANHLTNHPLAQNVKLSFSKDIGLGLLDPNGNTSLHGEKATDGSLITANISYFLNAYVDNAKDPYISLINNNIQTAPLVYMLLRSGVPVKTVTRILNQPIIKDYIKILLGSQSRASKLFNEVKNPINNVKEKYSVGVDVYESFDLRSQPSLDSFLEENIASIDNYTQLTIFNKFLELKDQAKLLNNLTKSCKTDVEGTTDSLINARLKLEERNEILESGEFINAEKLFSSDKPLATYTKNTLELSQKTLSSIILEGTPGFQATILATLKSLGMPATEDNIDLIKKDYKTYLYSKSNLFQTNNENRIQILRTLPKKIEEFKTKFPDSIFSKMLRLDYKNYIAGQPIITGKFGGEVTDQNLLTKSIEELFLTNPEITKDYSFKKLLFDLIAYDLMKNGFHKKFDSISSYLPINVINSRKASLANHMFFMEKELNYTSSPDMMFIEQFARNNKKDLKYVKLTLIDKKLTSDQDFKYIKSNNKVYKQMGLVDNSLVTLYEYKEIPELTVVGETLAARQYAKDTMGTDSISDPKAPVMKIYNGKENIVNLKASNSSATSLLFNRSLEVFKDLEVISNENFKDIKISNLENFKFEVREKTINGVVTYSLYSGSISLNGVNKFTTKESALSDALRNMKSIPYNSLVAILSKEC